MKKSSENKKKSKRSMIQDVRPGPNIQPQPTEDQQFKAQLKQLQELERYNQEFECYKQSLRDDILINEEISLYFQNVLQIHEEIRDIFMIQHLARDHLEREQRQQRQREQAQQRERIGQQEQQRKKWLQDLQSQRQRQTDNAIQSNQKMKHRKQPKHEQNQKINSTRVIERTLTLQIRIQSSNFSNHIQRQVINLQISADFSDNYQDVSQSDISTQNLHTIIGEMNQNEEGCSDSECECKKILNNGLRKQLRSDFGSHDTEHPDSVQQSNFGGKRPNFFFEKGNQNQESSQFSRQYSVRYFDWQLVSDEDSNSYQSEHSHRYFSHTRSQELSESERSMATWSYDQSSQFWSSHVDSQTSQDYSSFNNNERQKRDQNQIQSQVSSQRIKLFRVQKSESDKGVYLEGEEISSEYQQSERKRWNFKKKS